MTNIIFGKEYIAKKSCTIREFPRAKKIFGEISVGEKFKIESYSERTKEYEAISGDTFNWFWINEEDLNKIL